jgi:inositol phosphorylceramide mannosyltransferase catalytic subunit
MDTVLPGIYSGVDLVAANASASVSANTFPRIIHQTYKTHCLPTHWSHVPESWKRNNPGFRYIYWTDRDIDRFVSLYFPDYAKIIDSFPFAIQKIDTVRYMLLYHYGGVYADMDIECTRPSSYQADVLLPKTPNAVNTKQMTNSFMISKPRHPFWLYVLEQIKHYRAPFYHVGKHMKVMGCTGSWMITRCYNELQHRHRLGTIPSEIIMTCNVCSPKPCSSNDSFVRLLEGQSWNSIDTLILNYLFCTSVWFWVAMMALIIFLLVILYLYYSKKLIECRLNCAKGLSTP